NTNTLTEYEYDHPFNSNKNAYYRLKQTDFDGSFSYSKISIINCEDIFSDIVILPNPATNTILINGITTSTEVAIYGLTGKLLVAKNLDAIHHQIDVSNLPNGTYLIQFTNARNSSNKKILVYR
ncbi:MAG TPA: T9SS type A sorting domain-containing protein, partial [Chitinophagales bacterium]|nr:T9SS type A sorting domain-containing protein [Chitinophagales bacterium]